MNKEQDQYKTLLSALLPAELFEHFEIVEVVLGEKTLDVHLDELNKTPTGYEKTKLSSKGFRPPKVIQDFPIRERAVYLHIRRRKWLLESTGEIISTKWDTTAEGTRYTKGFASFLKELFGRLPH